MKTITVKWKVTPKRLNDLRKVAKSWGFKTVAAYIKNLVKVGSV